ncbi:Por secretion system C-terminal sorting domain-containing protein [Pustulibacterium marinum]|uniref:Por secretion system C-terminal sorting domain-containing protein n=1 Tax=Pustulibacterium marinum TaxID=1224947 RepID=A0A1I7HHJ8_9FLAO|nr:zinc-dependent metalloprotease [Pustulibacterium marinum]SFU60143.1 Por secretion system C-terminal sorting domain-containing protein [Pustulibacterium marinum]
MRKITFLLLLLFAGCLQSFGQQKKKNTTPLTLNSENQNFKQEFGFVRCLSSENEERLQELSPNRLTTEEFEAWIAPKVKEIKKRILASPNNKTMGTVVTIPVVVHVIHDGDAEGVDENISYERVASQITVLNEDYRRMVGTPGYNDNEVGADIEVEFCLAQTAPDGTLTDGIDRVNLSGHTWNQSNVESVLKPTTYWDPTLYFNIWTCEFGGNLNGVLGYAQFPNSSGLGGLSTNYGNADTDGVILDWRCFGSTDYISGETFFSGYDKGRTLTHEIGHALGLRHIWGDNSSCTISSDGTDSGQDYCPDTPPASQSNGSCATPINSCTNDDQNDMVENYMDYTYDTCMNIFTQDQKSRILAVLENSPRRASLLTSTVCSVPGPDQDNNGKLEIDTYSASVCDSDLDVNLKLTNLGSIDLTSATISYTLDEGTANTYSWTGTLAYGDSQEITLPTTGVYNSGDHTFEVSISTVNGIADENTENDTDSIEFSFYSFESNSDISLELQPDYYGYETTWELTDSDGNVLYNGGPYEQGSSNIFGYYLDDLDAQNFTLEDGCYTLTVFDSSGDGLCSNEDSDADGYFSLIANGETFYTGCEFSNELSVSFYLGTMGTDKFGLDTISLYPNPASNVLNINIGNNDLPDHYTIYNTLGQRVLESNISSESDLQINTSAIATGIYIVKITSGNQSTAMQFIKK